MDNNSSPMSLLDHLEELRSVLIKVFICIAVIFPFAFYFSQDVIDFIVKYGCPKGFELKYFSPLEPLWVQIKAAGILTIFVGLPYIACQIWHFIAPGLYRNERSFLSKLAIASWVLFILGAFCAFKFILPLLMKFSLSMQTSTLEPMINLQSFVNLLGMLIIGFGVMAQCPIVVFLLIETGLVEASTLKKQRPVVIVIILVLAAILTPPDVVSQVIMGVPAYALFEGSLLFASMRRKKKLEETQVDETEDKEYIPVENPSVTVEDNTINDYQEVSQHNPYPDIRNTKRKLKYSGRRGKISRKPR